MSFFFFDIKNIKSIYFHDSKSLETLYIFFAADAEEFLIFMKINHFPCDQGIKAFLSSAIPIPLYGIIFKVEKLILPDPTRTTTTSVIAINVKSKWIHL